MSVSSWSGATGHWRNKTDWSNGVPDASTDAEITGAGVYTITLARAGAFDVGAVDFNAAGATLALDGSLTLGGTFDLEAGVLAMSDHGVIHGGTLIMDGGVLTSKAKGGRLDGVHLIGALALSQAGETLSITGGLTGTTQAGTLDQIRLSGGEDDLRFLGSQTFDNATIILDDTVNFSAVGASGTLTLGANATLTTTASGAEGVVGATNLVNDGAIIAAASGALGTLNIDAEQRFTNNGLVTANSDMSIVGHSVVNAAGGMMNVGEDIDVYIEGGFRNLGAITIADGGVITIASDTSIVNAGTIAVNSGLLSIDQNVGSGVVKFTNTGAISVGQQGELQLLVNFTVASLGNIEDAGKLYVAGTLDNRGRTLQLGEGPIFGGAGTTLGYGGLISGGTVVLGQSKLALTGGGLANVKFEGVLDLKTVNASLNLDGGVIVTGADGTGPGVINLIGAGATLNFFDATGVTANAIDNVTINAGDATRAVNIQLVNFDDAAETLTLGAHASIVSTTAGAQVLLTNQDAGVYTVINAGQIDAGASGGTFAVSIATFENDGQVTVAGHDAFTLTGALTGSGGISIATSGVATLGAADAGQSVAFADASGTLRLTSAASFAATVSGAVAGDRIDLVKTAATNASVNGSDQLVITNNGAAAATLQLSGNYADTVFNVGSDGAGGSVITLASAPNAHGFAQAMAGLGTRDPAAGHAIAGAHLEQVRTRMLAAPALR